MGIQKNGGDCIMKVGDLVVEHIDDRLGTIIKIEKEGAKKYMPMIIVLMAGGSIQRFPIAYLGRYK